MGAEGYRGLLTELWWAGIEAVQGRSAVGRHLERTDPVRPDSVLAVGKAACSMAAGVQDRFGTGIPTLVITKDGHGTDLPGACAAAAPAAGDSNRDAS